MEVWKLVTKYFISVEAAQSLNSAGKQYRPTAAPPLLTSGRWALSVAWAWAWAADVYIKPRLQAVWPQSIWHDKRVNTHLSELGNLCCCWRKEGTSPPKKSRISLVFLHLLRGVGWLLRRLLGTGTGCLSSLPTGREDLMLGKGKSWPEGWLPPSRGGFSPTPGSLWMSFERRFLFSLGSVGTQ